MNEEIYHFGVKGMKWGVRKKRDQPSVKSLRSTASASKMKDQNKNYVNNKGQIRSRAALAGRRVAIEAAINVGGAVATGLVMRYGGATLGSLTNAISFGASVTNLYQGVREQKSYRYALEKSQK